MSDLSKVVLVFISWTAEIRGVQTDREQVYVKTYSLFPTLCECVPNALVAEENSAQKNVASGCNRRHVLKTCVSETMFICCVECHFLKLSR